MKKAQVSLLALSLLAGGTLAASAAATHTGSDYDVTIAWTNPAPTSIFFLEGVPVPDTNTSVNVTVLNDDVTTDGGGKIDGAAVYRITFLSGASNNTVLAIADIVCDVSGVINLKGATPTATVQIKGNGASVDSAGVIGAANLSLKFTGSPTNLTRTGSTTFTGNFTGTVKVGLASVNGGKPINVGAKGNTATGSAGGFGIGLSFDGQVVQSDTKMYIIGFVGDGGGFNGNGSINSKQGKYTANLQGFAFAKGSTLSLSGTTGSQTNVWFQFGTNPPVQATISVPGTADAKGKVAGQTIKATGGVVTATSLF